MSPALSSVKRFEVFTDAGKRRDWLPEVKVSIVAESYSGVEAISILARRHGMIPSQLFTWRRQLREQAEAEGLRKAFSVKGMLGHVDKVRQPFADGGEVEEASEG